MQPVYVVFAGVNGAGKSTFYRTGLWRTEDMPRTMARGTPTRSSWPRAVIRPPAPISCVPGVRRSAS